MVDNIDKFNRAYSKINLIILNTDLSYHYCSSDIAILPFIPSKAGYSHDYLMTFNLSLYAGREYLKKLGEPKIPEDLDNHRLITYGDKELLFSSHQMDWFLSLGSKITREPYIRINSALGLFNLAQKNIGIVSLAKENLLLKQSSLKEVLSNIKGPALKAYFVCPKHLKESYSIKTVKHFIQEVIKENEWQ